MTDTLIRSEEFYKLHRELNHCIPQYGTACLNGDKAAAVRILATINESLYYLDMLTKDLERTENQEHLNAALLADIAQDSE